MILINGYWEQIYDLQDISKIIRENYNRDLADELDRLIPKYTNDDYLELKKKYKKSEKRVYELEAENYDLANRVNLLECKVDELEDRINDEHRDFR